MRDTGQQWEAVLDPARPTWPGVLVAVRGDFDAGFIQVCAGDPRNFADSHALATRIVDALNSARSRSSDSGTTPAEIDQAILDFAANTSAGEIVAASNTLHDLLARMHTPSIEAIVRAVILAWLKDDAAVIDIREIVLRSAPPAVSETNQPMTTDL